MNFLKYIIKFVRSLVNTLWVTMNCKVYGSFLLVHAKVTLVIVFCEGRIRRVFASLNASLTKVSSMKPLHSEIDEFTFQIRENKTK